MLFDGVAITASATADFQKRDHSEVIKGIVGEVKIDWERFISVFCSRSLLTQSPLNLSYGGVTYMMSL